MTIIPHDASPDGLGLAAVDRESVDTVVCILTLCSHTDPHGAIAAFRDRLRPGGKLVFYEHCLSMDRSTRRFQRLMHLLGWSLVAGNCNLMRTTDKSILDGFRWSDSEVGGIVRADARCSC